jgi:hypothetical protein
MEHGRIPESGGRLPVIIGVTGDCVMYSVVSASVYYAMMFLSIIKECPILSMTK